MPVGNQLAGFLEYSLIGLTQLLPRELVQYAMGLRLRLFALSA